MPLTLFIFWTYFTCALTLWINRKFGVRFPSRSILMWHIFLLYPEKVQDLVECRHVDYPTFHLMWGSDNVLTFVLSRFQVLIFLTCLSGSFTIRLRMQTALGVYLSVPLPVLRHVERFAGCRLIEHGRFYFESNDFHRYYDDLIWVKSS